ncbi:ornithine carbamoyltransferase [Candidatus Woesearchaeota archaeon]|nr:ornithine carbamoyltransferase [Candidatus Woesearchaeota archaeon]
MKKRHLLALRDFSAEEIHSFIDLAGLMKKYPWWYRRRLRGKTLLMLFAKPSLRTRLSFETAMLELGGHAIFYDIATSPLGKKESIEDGARVSSLYVDAIMARLYEHETIEEFARYSSVPVINGLTNRFHPCQVLGDLLTIKEHFGNFNIKLSYVGDANNNVTHSLMVGCSKVGITMNVACPRTKEFMPEPSIANETGVPVVSMKEAVKDADVIYTDTWQSYHIKDSAMKRRKNALMPFQVNQKNFNDRAYFMHCLPAQRGMEVTADIIDGERSLVLQQAGNRKHIEKAILLKLIG